MDIEGLCRAGSGVNQGLEFCCLYILRLNTVTKRHPSWPVDPASLQVDSASRQGHGLQGRA